MEKIFIVEDDNVTALEVKHRIMELGYEVAGISDNGEDAISKVSELNPDLILMDIGLSGKLDGIQTYEKILEKYNVPLVFITGNSDESLSHRAMKTNPYGYLFKPLSGRELNVAIELALYKSKVEKILLENERLLNKKQSLLQSILDTTPAMLCIIDEKYKIAGTNRKFRDITGYNSDFSKKSHAIGDILHCISAVSSKKGCGHGLFCHRCTLRNMLINTFTSQQPHKDVEHQIIVMKNNIMTTLTFLTSTSFLQNESSDNVLLTLVDITSRKEMEIALKKSENKLRTVFETMGEGLLICEMIIDEGGKFDNLRIIDINPAFEKITDMKRASVIGKPVTEVFDITHGFMLSFWDRHAGKEKITEIEVFIKKIDKWLHASVSQPLNNILVVSFFDISNRLKSQIELKNKNALLNKSNSEKNKLFSIIAHDLKSPFQGFIGMTDLIANNLHSFSIDELGQISKEMHVSAKNLFTLLKNLLEWSALQQDSISMNLNSFRLSELMINAYHSVEHFAMRKEISLEINIPEDTVVMADPTMLNSIFINLLSNAIKFSHRGGKIHASAADRNDGLIEVTVADEGIGMPPGMVDKLFKIEEKVGRKGTEGELSSGLGLILCRDFISKMGGHIWAESFENQGTKFHFTLKRSGSLV